MTVLNGPRIDSAQDVLDLSPLAMREALENLRLHHIELEMQNEELRRTQAALDTANSRFFDFYDLAPVGYVTVGDMDVIIQANLSIASQLGLPRSELIGKVLPRFFAPTDADNYYLLRKQALASKGVQVNTELRMCRVDGAVFWVSLRAVAVTGDNGLPVLRLVLSDITQRRQLEQAASEASEDKFRLVADNTFDGILILGADGHIEYTSPAYLSQLGYADVEELRRSVDSIYDLVHPQDREALCSDISRASASVGGDQLYCYRVQHRQGHYCWRESSARFQYDAAGRLLRTCFVVRDITQRRKTEAFQRIAAVAFETKEAILITDKRTVILLVNQAFTRTTGYSAEDAVGQTPKFLRSGHHDEAFYQQSWDTVRRTGGWQGEVWDRHKDGAIAPKWLTVTAVKSDDGVVTHYVGSYVDLSERKRAENAMLEMNRRLAQSRQQLRRLVALNETRLEKERQHIAREVHDELGQVLTALRMDMSLAIIRHADHQPALEAQLNGMKVLVDRAIQAMRNVTTSLRPAALDMGLVPSIEWLRQEFVRHGDLSCEFNAPAEPIELDAGRDVVIFRVVQESLTNIRKYAHASQVLINLVQCGQELLLEVRDNGLGFDPAVAARQGALGLVGMRERVISLGGQLDIKSAPGEGTVIAVVIPLDLVMTRGAM